MDIKRFYYPTQVFWGTNCVQKLSDFLTTTDTVLLMTDKALLNLGLPQRVSGVLQEQVSRIVLFSDVMPNPEIQMIYQATTLAQQEHVTAIVAVGGGSVMDAAKTVAMLATQEGAMADYGERGKQPMRPSLPCYVVPTTSGTGSEGSSVAVVSYSNAGKRGIWSDSLFVSAAFLDTEMTLELPEPITAATAMDALDHAVEAYIGLDQQPILDALCLHAIRLIARYLPAAYEQNDPEARAQLSAAALMAGIGMGQSGTGIVHSMADRLGEHYHTPHGLGIAILLPVCLRYNAQAAASRLADIAAAMDLNIGGCSVGEAANMAVTAIEALARRVGIPTRVQGNPLSEDTIRQMADTALHHFITDNNPRRPTVEELMDLFCQVLPQ